MEPICWLGIFRVLSTQFIDSHQVLLLPALHSQYTVVIVKARSSPFSLPQP